LVLELAFIAMEALAFFVIGAVFAGAGGHEGMSYPAYLLAEAGGFFLVRGLLRIDISHRALVIAGGLISVFALITIAGLEFDPSSFPPGWGGVLIFLRDPGDATNTTRVPVLYGVILLVVVWGRGIFAAQDQIERGRALRSFSIGLVVLVVGLLFGQESSARQAVNAASIPLVALGLLSLSLIQLREARPEGGDPLRGPWLLISLGTVGGLVLVGAIIGVLPLGPGGWVYDHAIAPVLTAGVILISWVIIALAFPFAWLISVIFTHLFGGHALQPPRPPTSTDDTVQNFVKGGSRGGAAAFVVVLVKLLVILIVVAILAYIAYRLFRRLHRTEAEGEERESLAGEGSWRGDLAALWNHLRPRRPRSAVDEPPPLSSRALEVRRLYLRMLDRAARDGFDRPPGATPLEFEPRLEEAFAQAGPAEVTEGFVETRYGLAEPTDDELQRLRSIVENLT
jgi:hypothetical protein